MFFTHDGIVTSPFTPATSVVPSFEQSNPLLELYFAFLSSTANDLKAPQLENAHRQTFVKLAGIVTDVKLLQPQKAESPMLVTFDEIVTDVRLQHFPNTRHPDPDRNSFLPMLVTGHPPSIEGIVIEPVADWDNPSSIRALPSFTV